MKMDIVWARDPIEGFVLGQIHEILDDGAEVVPLDTKYPKRVLSYSDIYSAHKDMHPDKDYDDNCEMMFLNEGALLHNIRIRYYKNKIYTYVANILIAVNPYKEIPEMYSADTIRRYQGKSLGQMAPHVFAIADKAFRDMKVLKQSQSIIVSGESGAGKTESTKHLLKYLCNTWQSQAGPIEQKILDANPVLEAFGNAKTTRNNNSSRFGKFIEVHFDKQFHVAGGHISHYLLEKSRICSPQGDERSYHIFYLLMAGAPEQLRKSLFLTKPDDFNYLQGGCTSYFTKPHTEGRLANHQKSASHIRDGGLKDTLLDDVEGFSRLDSALERLGITQIDRLQIYSTVAAVLHLGNIEFEDNPEDKRGGCKVSVKREKTLKIVSQLLGIEADELRQALESRVMQSSRGGIKGTVIMVPLKVHEANHARDALAKAIYSNLFDYIVNQINQSIPFQVSNYYIGVLDIAGFEFFTVNSFEQFCINYCNEKLQQFFNEIILKNEQELYKREGLRVPEVKFTDNQDCIDLIEAKSTGILTILDEESKLPKPSYMHFTVEVHKSWPNEFRLALPRSSKLKAHRSLRDDEGFLVRHFAGAVCYQTKHFIEKNNDALHASLEGIVQDSRNQFMKNLFATSNTKRGKLTFISVGSKFKAQLMELMDKLRKNGTNFIRCIKPNSRMTDNQFDGAISLMQLKCSGMTSVLELMEHGYPSRAPFADLYSMYKGYLPAELQSLNAKTFCEAMLHSLKLRDKDFKFGITKVFFRPGKFAEFDKIMTSDPEHLRAIVKDVKRFLIKSRWIKSQFCALTVVKLKNKIIYRRRALIVIQKHVRGYFARKKYGVRIKTLRKIKGIDITLNKMERIAHQLKKDKEITTNEINHLRSEVLLVVDRIKNEDSIKSSVVELLEHQLIAKVDSQMTVLQKRIQDQKNAEEQTRLRKIQEEMEQEKLRKQQEDMRIKAEEDHRRRKVELESQRKIEEERRLKQEEEDRKTALLLQQDQENDVQYQQQLQARLEQERQDLELALRLAHESNSQLEDSPPMLRNGVLGPSKHMHPASRLENGKLATAHGANDSSKSKYDLTKWKYSELRDTINTSCDIELLEACRHEFHRRLKVYHAWKAKNRNRRTTSDMEENERAPKSVMESALRAAPRLPQKTSIYDTNAQRYFRIPFVRPGNDNNKRGWWYAHFDGQYVARQIELHPEKAPILLCAGTDDMQMCELSLEETGLTRKRGAEILDTEFNKEWERHGGEKYIRPADRKKITT